MIPDKPSPGKKNNALYDFWLPIIFTVSLYLGIRTYLGEARYIPSGSMLPGLQINDRLFIEKVTLKLRNPIRGELVVFNSPYSFDPILSSGIRKNSFKCLLANAPIFSSFYGLSNPVCDAYIKRIIAISGDQVFVNQKGEVSIDGKKINEIYQVNYCLKEFSSVRNCPIVSRVVPEKHVFVLGDNRSNSWDSRFWPGGGFLPVEDILGRAVWRFWPFNRLGKLSFKTTFNYLS